MATTQEMFRFVTTRRPERVVMSRINARLVRDARKATAESLLVELFGRGPFPQKLQAANAFVAGDRFLGPGAPAIAVLDNVAEFFRAELVKEAPLTDLRVRLEELAPEIAALLEDEPEQRRLQLAKRLVGRLWDSLYAQVVRGCDRYLSTHHLADGLRAFQVLRILRHSKANGIDSWLGELSTTTKS